MKTPVAITEHAYARGMERYGFSERQTASRVESALKYGKRCSDFEPGDERHFLERKSREGHFAVAYNKKCYIFSDCNVCITTFALPRWFGQAQKWVKKRVSRFCRYSYDDMYEDYCNV